jgi:hypothetical protein
LKFLYHLNSKMPNSKYNRSRRGQRRQNNNKSINMNSVGRLLNSHRINLQGVHVPDHTTNPIVSRTIRYQASLTPTPGILNITATTISNVDSTDYLGSSTARYSYLRVNLIKVWMITGTDNTIQYPTLVVAQSATVAGQPDFTVQDTPSPGSDVAAVGIRAGLLLRETWLPVADTTVLFTITTNPVTTSEVGIRIIADLSVDFN